MGRRQNSRRRRGVVGHSDLLPVATANTRGASRNGALPSATDLTRMGRGWAASFAGGQGQSGHAPETQKDRLSDTLYLGEWGSCWASLQPPGIRSKRRFQTPFFVREKYPVISFGPQEGGLKCGQWLLVMASWCEELTHWKRPWRWERSKVGGEGDDRGWDGWMASPTPWTWVWVDLGVGDGQGGLACCSPWGHKESDTPERLNWTELMEVDRD